MTFGALIIIHNAIEHDYCVRECIRSVLPICDRVLVVECESTDGTDKMLAEMAEKEPKIAVIQHPWKPSPAAQRLWISITHATKKLIGTDWYIAMDADEVISPDDYCAIQAHVNNWRGTNNCGVLYRWTFWKDAQHVIPEGIICSHRNPRVGPTTESLCGDLIDPPRSQWIPANIYHYGHIREKKAWARKSVKCHQWAFGQVPSWWTKAIAGDWSGVDAAVPDSRLLPFTGKHPLVIHQWLRDRGHHV